jgi:pimeloyl-ACP methyl ester carboxylesterase
MPRERRIEFVSEGVPVVGTLRLPDQLERAPVVVCCQGFSLTKEVWLGQHAAAMNDAGFATLNIDYRFFGESGGEPRCRLVPQAQVQDVRNALTFLETVPEVDSSRMGVFGISLGASVATAVAGLDSRVSALVAVAGPGDLERVWSNFADFDTFRAKVHTAKKAFVSAGTVTYVAVPRILSSDPQTCELLVKEQASHPRWRLEITFESLEDLFAFKPEHEAATSAASMFIYPTEDALISKLEVMSLFAKARAPKRLVPLVGMKHHEVYAQGAAFEPVVQNALAFFGQYLSSSAHRETGRGA